ncbi:hypothetical protein [Micromonospora sp. WMMD812]|uniref:hypothetical protein n=1 Tax=Micromonospora sp. WMMD812 TaxID=3015152 RepID=UPI00248BE6E0|nr:hypothetical protein [Micromonospora sp. WMMD812]WBB67688.1 hypothetical protein O7603_32230 [Micromonospora sp. WMMD812]
MRFGVSSVNGEELRGLEGRLHPVYRQCFAGSPWNESTEELDGYPSKLARQSGYPGAYGLVATGGVEVAGVIYGWPAPAVLPAATEFDLAVREAASAEVAALLIAPAVVVAELMVAPAFRRRGVARTRLRRFVARAPRAWLATHPESDAVALYEAEGWLRRFGFVIGDHPLIVYTKETGPAVG